MTTKDYLVICIYFKLFFSEIHLIYIYCKNVARRISSDIIKMRIIYNDNNNNLLQSFSLEYRLVQFMLCKCMLIKMLSI